MSRRVCMLNREKSLFLNIHCGFGLLVSERLTLRRLCLSLVDLIAAAASSHLFLFERKRRSERWLYSNCSLRIYLCYLYCIYGLDSLAKTAPSNLHYSCALDPHNLSFILKTGSNSLRIYPSWGLHSHKRTSTSCFESQVFYILILISI